jgi:multiple sugar transport system substrate-binding protein
MGGSFFAEDGITPTLNTKEAIRATEWYCSMLEQFGPPGVVNFNWNEAISIFAQGEAAMGYDSANFTSRFEDPADSKVVGKVGYMLLPPDASTGIVDAGSGAAGLAISRGSLKKEAAWYFVQWATGKEMTLKAQVSGVGTSRSSAWESEEFKNNTKMPVDWVIAFQEALKITKLSLPPLKGTNEFRNIVGIEIQSVIQGADPKAAMDRAQQAVEKFMIDESK